MQLLLHKLSYKTLLELVNIVFPVLADVIGAILSRYFSGPNCAHGNMIIPEGKNVTLSNGDVAFCSQGDIYGGSVVIYDLVG